jgi:hypothetical protein
VTISIRRILVGVSATAACVLTVGVVSAFAAAPEVPRTEVAQSVTGISAVFEGVLNPRSKAMVGGFFAYSEPGGLTCLEGLTMGLEGFEGEREVQAQGVHAAVGLQPSRKYVVCLVASNEGGAGLAAGNEVEVVTPAVAPAILSESAPGPKAREARLEGFVNPNNQVTECHFRFGTDPSLVTGTTTASCETENGMGTIEGFSEGGDGVALNLSGLSKETVYYYRVIVKNAKGEKAEGAIAHFLTGPPEAPETFSPAKQITATTATLEGVLNPNAEAQAGWYFEYDKGASCTGGETTGVEGEALVKAETVSKEVTRLQPNAQYSFCLVATNEGG